MIKDDGNEFKLEEIKASRHCLTDINHLSSVKINDGEHKTILSGKGLVIY